MANIEEKIKFAKEIVKANEAAIKRIDNLPKTETNTMFKLIASNQAINARVFRHILEEIQKLQEAVKRGEKVCRWEERINSKGVMVGYTIQCSGRPCSFRPGKFCPDCSGRIVEEKH